MGLGEAARIGQCPRPDTAKQPLEEIFGWMKTTGLLRKLRHRGGPLVEWIFTFTAAAYNLVRLRTLLTAAA